MEYFEEEREKELARIRKEQERDESGRFKAMELPDIEEILPMLINGDPYRKIAGFYNISLASLMKLLSLPTNVPRVRQSLALSADAYAELALKALDDAEMTMPGVTIAREKAAYYKWLAAKRNPSTYSDKQEINVNRTNTKIVVKAPEPLNIQHTEVKSYIDVKSSDDQVNQDHQVRPTHEERDPNTDPTQ